MTVVSGEPLQEVESRRLSVKDLESRADKEDGCICTKSGPGTTETCKVQEAGTKWGGTMHHCVGVTDCQGSPKWESCPPQRGGRKTGVRENACADWAPMIDRRKKAAVQWPSSG